MLCELQLRLGWLELFVGRVVVWLTSVAFVPLYGAFAQCRAEVICHVSISLGCLIVVLSLCEVCIGIATLSRGRGIAQSTKLGASAPS